MEMNACLEMLYTSFRKDGGNESDSAYRQLLRILDRLTELNLVDRYGYGRSINWKLTEFGAILHRSHL